MLEAKRIRGRLDQTKKLQFVNIDLIGPVDVASNNNKYILTIKDKETSYLVTAPIPDKTTLTVRDAFVQNWFGY